MSIRSRIYRAPLLQSSALPIAVLTAGLAALSVLLALSALPGDTWPAGSFGTDYAAYHAGAERMADGLSPYQPEQLLPGLDNQAFFDGVSPYRYPPTLAWLLMPLAALPFEVASGIWLVLGIVAIGATTLFAARASGAGRRGMLWALALTALWFPTVEQLRLGNVTALLTAAWAAALLMPPAASGVAAVAATCLKISPAPLLGAVVLRRWRPALAAIAAATLFGVVLPWLLQPQAWSDFLATLPYLTSGETAYNNNLALDAVLIRHLGAPSPWPEIARMVSLFVAVGLGLAALLALRRKREAAWPFAVASLDAAVLVAPGVIWSHYPLTLLPVAIMAFARAGLRMRIGLLACWAVSSVLVPGNPWLMVAGLWGGSGLILAALWPKVRLLPQRRQ